MFVSPVESAQNVPLLLCFPYQGMAKHLAVLSSVDDITTHPSGCKYCITRAGEDWSTTAGLDKLALCRVVQMALLFIYSLSCMLKEHYENC